MKRAQLTAAKHVDRYSRIAHLLRTACRYCHAPAGEPCRSKSGAAIWDIGQIHDARLARRQLPLPPIRPERLAKTNLLEHAICGEREPPGR
jgi:hypothetical protein